MDDIQLTSLAKQSRFNNLIYQISGLLVYSNQQFYQILEGEKDSIELVYSKIEQDNRHKDILLLTKEAIASRTFWRWSLGLVTIRDKSDVYTQLIDYIRENKSLASKNIDDASFIFEAFSKDKFQEYIS